jgi:hypothetical protein
MSKKLTLKPRLKDGNGDYTWHDKYILTNAMSVIAKNKTIVQLAPFISVAGKIEIESEKINLGEIRKRKGEEEEEVKYLHLPELSITLNNQEASLFWRELEKLPFESYGSPIQCRKCGSNVINVPNVGALYQMLTDIAKDFGEKITQPDEDSSEENLNELS